MRRLMPAALTKMSGAGNTFILIDARIGSLWVENEKSVGMSRAEFATLICDKVLGVCADGLLFIESGSDEYDFLWDFYNSDGSTAEMCGNAARCAAKFCAENFAGNLNIIKFKTGAGLVTTEILPDNKIRVQMPEAKIIKQFYALTLSSGAAEIFSLINTGVPHLTKNIVNISEALTLKELAREARSHRELQPAGANVTFYVEDSVGKINAVTFERGVEDYTLACGTGAVAAALAYSRDSQSKEVEVRMPGGILKVYFNDGDPRPVMIGDAIFIGEFKYNLEVIK